MGTPACHHDRVTSRPPLATSLGAALAALLLTTAGCGSDDVTTNASDSPTSTSPTLPSETPTSEPPAPEPTTAEPTSAEPTETEPPTPPPTAEPDPPQPTKAPPAPQPDAPPTTYDDAEAHFDAVGQEPQMLQRFESPDGNLYCVLDNDYLPAACEIDKGAVRDPGFCGPGPSTLVGRIEFADGDPQAVCNSDTIREPGADVLEVGSVAGWKGTTYQCLLEDVGLTCIDTAAPRGFFLTEGRYQVFAG